MKTLKVNFLFFAALMLGGGMAIAHNTGSAANTVFYNNAAEGQPENWQPVQPGQTLRCDANPDNECSQTRDENGTVISSQSGDASLI